MFEYKVVPAPKRGLKSKGIKGTEARFANALQAVMNELGANGWEYQRTDTLPVEERQGLTGKTTNFQNMLVFRRTLAVAPVAELQTTTLIEDKTEDTVKMAEAEAPETDAPADRTADVSTPAAATEDRVSDTLNAPGVHVLKARHRTVEAQPSDDPQLPAE